MAPICCQATKTDASCSPSTRRAGSTRRCHTQAEMHAKRMHRLPRGVWNSGYFSGVWSSY
jgi:hypothetical protein